MSAFEPGKEYQTRDGQKVRIYAVDGGGEFPIHGALFENGEWFADYWKKTGGYGFDEEPSINDLIAHSRAGSKP